MAIKRGSKVEISGSSASMTDLMFLLLIFLMIATTLINTNALKLTLPSSTAPSKDKIEVTVSITENRELYVGEIRVTFQTLEKALQEALKGADEKRVSLRADKSTPLDDVVKVMNVAKKNKYKLDLATNPE